MNRRWSTREDWSAANAFIVLYEIVSNSLNPSLIKMSPNKFEPARYSDRAVPALSSSQHDATSDRIRRCDWSEFQKRKRHDEIDGVCAGQNEALLAVLCVPGPGSQMSK